MTPAELATLRMSVEVLLWALGALALVLGPWLAYANRFKIRDLLRRFRKRPALGGHHVTEIDINELERRIMEFYASAARGENGMTVLDIRDFKK